MGIHSCFAANLRQLCFRYRTITEVCDGIGINRQQFNKYLAGSSLPNTFTLNRICKFFGLPEEELFRTKEDSRLVKEAAATSPSITQAVERLKSLGDLLAVHRGNNSEPQVGALLPGLYHCYFPLQGNREFLLRTLVLVRRECFGTTFTRLTLFPSARDTGSFLARSKHYGLVVANDHDVFLVGVNHSPPHQLSFISMELPCGKRPTMLSGLAVVGTSTGTMAGRVCLQRLEGTVSAKNAVRMLGPVPQHCRTVPSLIRLALAADFDQQTNQLAAITYSQLLVRNMAPEVFRLTG